MIQMIFLAALAHAQSADEIIAKARAAQKVRNSIQQMKMVLVSKSGSTRERRFEMRVRKDADALRSYVRFSYPTDVAGTQLVLVDHPETVDEQLLYMPALRRTTRIAGRARSGSFMGSDFSFEDLEVSDASDATHVLAEQTETTWIIDTTPGEGSSYTSIRSHISKSDSVPRMVEFYKSGTQIKQLEITSTEQDGSTVVPMHTIMKNLSRGTHTELTVESYRLNVSAEELPDETFTAGFMERSG
jgi:hypothetical protein